MPFIDWKDSYNCGVKEIDNQHRGLFDLISKLFKIDHIYRHEKYFLATFELFVKYTKTHFAAEERYMQEANYAKLVEHKKEHNDFILELIELYNELEKQESDVHDKILVFLKDWYLAHILGTDRDYIEAFQKKGIK